MSEFHKNGQEHPQGLDSGSYVLKKFIRMFLSAILEFSNIFF